MAKPLTYEQFQQILTQLGFTSTSAPGYTLYREKDHDAILVIPDVSPDEPVLPVHLIAARETVLAKGIALSARIRRLLTPSTETSVPNEVTDIGDSRKHRAKIHTA